MPKLIVKYTVQQEKKKKKYNSLSNNWGLGGWYSESGAIFWVGVRGGAVKRLL